MREAIPAIAVAALVALFVGAAASYFLFANSEPQRNQPSGPVGELPQNSSGDGSALPTPEKRDNSPALEKLLNEANTRASELEKERNTLKSERDTLSSEKAAQQQTITELEARVKELKELADGPNLLLISYGKWAETRQVRETDWNDLGDAYAKMTPLLQQYAAAAAKGEAPDAETMSKIREQNQRLIAYYAKVIGKLPTHANTNGEFTHPINLVNILAGQLAEMGLPLSDQQKQELAKLGEEFDRRWGELETGYTETTWKLQKLVDEADLKQWFYDEMFKVTTAEQRAAAVPPELQGLIGLDLYSPGLMLQGSIAPLRAMDLPAMKGFLKDSVAEATGIARETLDGADYIFDDWLNSLQLQPMTQLELGVWRTLPVLKAGKAQLAGLHALDDSVVTDEEVRKKLRFVQTIVVPQLVKQE
jgi:hypothetical protein